MEKAGAVRDGGSFEDRMGKVACWNSVMDEDRYMGSPLERVHRRLRHANRAPAPCAPGRSDRPPFGRADTPPPACAEDDKE